MFEWQRQIQQVVDEIDEEIKKQSNEDLTLANLSKRSGYSEFYMTRKFKAISGMSFRDYLRYRKLAFALKEVRDSEKSMLEIALNYGFSSHEAFTRSFKHTYGVSPSDYRKRPKPVVLRTKINPFDRYFLGLGEIGILFTFFSRKRSHSGFDQFLTFCSLCALAAARRLFPFAFCSGVGMSVFTGAS